VTSLAEFFAAERAAGRPLVAAFVVATEGSTYRKPGALMLFSAGGTRCGLLSGGCLEADIQEHALRLLTEGARAATRSYDSRGSDDPIWGLGLGCEGLMRILLLRVDASTGYEPLRFLLESAEGRDRGASAIVVSATTKGAHFPGAFWNWHERRGARAGTPAAVTAAGRSRATRGGASLQRVVLDGQDVELFVTAVERRPALLLCGAGPDAVPVASLASGLGWRVTLVDHRPAYVDPARFAPAQQLFRVDADRLGESIELGAFDAAVVMSHHLVADGHYLAQLADAPIPYVGLLGPAARRERLYAEIGPEATQKLRPRLRAPVGLDLGGRTPEAIALSIVAEIQAVLNDRRGQPFSAPHQGTFSPV
jgi:xanthine dehydrogenase accessory factor